VVLVCETRLVAILVALPEAKSHGDGAGVGVERGMFSCVNAFASMAANAGVWREFKLITPPRGSGVAVGVGLGVGVASVRS